MTTLTLIALAGLLGPLLAMSKRIAVPVVVGEIIGGVLIGPAGFDLVSMGDPLVDTLHAAGFALLMFTIGMHLPLRDPRLRSEAKKGLLATLVVYSAGAIIGVAIAEITGVGHPIAHARSAFRIRGPAGRWDQLPCALSRCRGTIVLR